VAGNNRFDGRAMTGNKDLWRMMQRFLCFAMLMAFFPTESRAQSVDDVKKMIIKKCDQEAVDDVGRAKCREKELTNLKDYITLLNKFPKNSKQYQVLVSCSAKWPEYITMWKLCAKIEIPEEHAFNAFTLPNPGLPIYDVVVDPKSLKLDKNGLPAPVTFIQNNKTQPPSTSSSVTNQGVYIPGGVKR